MRHSEITEWWDYSGDHHEGAPTPNEMLDDARKMTVHLWNDSGDNIYFTTFSDDGWTEEELAEDIDDAGEGYGVST